MRIATKQEFLRLVAMLAADQDLKTWENSSAPDFVEALGNWLEDVDRFYQSTGHSIDTSQPLWHRDSQSISPMMLMIFILSGSFALHYLEH